MCHLPSSVLGGEVNIGMPLFFLTNEGLLPGPRSSKFSWEEVTEDCLDLGIVKVVLPDPEVMFKLLLELEFDISPA